jgi:hypothetical protein
MAINPFTGEDDGVSDTLQPIVTGARNVGQGINDTLLRDPESRSALLQIGLGLMQPTAMGQTFAGHIGQAVGSGGEAVHRIAEEDIKQQRADDALTIAQQRMDLAAARVRDPNTLTEAEKQRLALGERTRVSQERAQTRMEAREIRMAKAARDKNIRDDVKQAIKERDSPLTSDSSEWSGKKDSEIRQHFENQYPPVDAPTPGEEPAVEGAALGAPTAVPPPQKRVAGQVYPTPKGKLKWTGTGWVTP